MKKPDELFLLIKSMSKSEKRYFKIYSARHTSGEKNNYLRLFEYLDRLEKYDELKIKNEFKTEKFTKNFFAIKKYLFDVILNSLLDYNKEKLVVHKLHEDLLRIKILIYKGLKKSALKLSEKTLQTAKAHSQNFIVQELLEIQSEKLYESDFIHYENKLKRMNVEKFEALDELISRVRYSALFDKVYTVFHKTPVANSVEEIEELNWLTEDPLFIDENNARGFNAREDLLKMKSYYYWFVGDYNKSLEYRKKRALLLDDYPEIYKNELIQYVYNIHGYLIYAWFELSDKECEYYLSKIKIVIDKIIKNSKDESTIKNAFMVMIIMDVLWWERKSEAEKIYKKVESLNNEFHKIAGRLEPSKFLDIHSAIGAALFRMGHFQKSLSLTNVVLNHKDIKLMQTLHHVNLVRAVVIHFELCNYDTAESLIKTLNRVNKENLRVLPSEKYLISSINKLMRTNSAKQANEILGELKISIESLFEKSVLDKIFILRMGLINWIDKQIQNIKIKRQSY